MSIKTMADLLKKQEAERQDLAAGVHSNWQKVQEQESKLLSPAHTYENAPIHIQEKIMQIHQQFFAEWGSEGRLATLMSNRHTKERKRLIQKMDKVEELQQTFSRSPDRDYDR